MCTGLSIILRIFKTQTYKLKKNLITDNFNIEININLLFK